MYVNIYYSTNKVCVYSYYTTSPHTHTWGLYLALHMNTDKHTLNLIVYKYVMLAVGLNHFMAEPFSCPNTGILFIPLRLILWPLESVSSEPKSDPWLNNSTLAVK